MIKDYAVTDEGIFFEETRKKLQLTNFRITISEFIQAENTRNSIQILLVTLSLSVNGSCIEFATEVLFTGLADFDPSQIDARLCIYPGRNVREHFVAYIRLLLSNIPIQNQLLFDALGGHVFEDKHLYCAGNLILGENLNSVSQYLIPELRKYNVDYDKLISRKDAFHAFLNLVSIEQSVSDVIALCIISGYMRELLNEAKMPDGGTLLLAGKSQSRKTTLLELANSFYNHKSSDKINTLRLDSSLSYLQEFISGFKHATVNIDDLFKASEKSDQYKFRTILRQRADRTIRHNRFTDADITQTQLAVTSEILLNNVSDLGRTVLILLKKPINSERLCECQHKQDELVAFYVHFIDWMYSNFDRLVQLLKEELALFEYDRNKNAIRYERINEHNFILFTAAKFVLLYAIEYEIINEYHKNIIYETLENNILSCSKTQTAIMEYVARKSGEEELNPAKALVSCLNAGAIRPGTSDDDCFIRQKNGVTFLWIKTAMLTFTLNRIFRYEYTDRYYTKYFARKNILVREASSKSNTKRYNNTRYLVIRLDLLEEEACSIEGFADSFLQFD